MDPLLIEEIARILRAEIRKTFSKYTFPPPFVPAPKVQAVTDNERFNEPEQRAAESEQRDALYTGNKEPIFDAKFTVFDQEPNNSTTMCSSALFNAEFTVYDEQLVFDTEYASHEELVFNEEDKGLAFDIEPTSNGLGVDGLTTGRIGYNEDPILDEGPLFDEESNHGEEEANTNTELVLGSIITIAATMVVDVRFSDTTVDTSVKCLTKCSGDGSRGWHREHFHEGLELIIIVQGDTTAPVEALRSVIYNGVATDVFEHKFWDPGSSEGSKFSRFGVYVDSAHHNEVHMDGFEYTFWDPGLKSGSSFIELTRSGVDCHYAKLYWLPLFCPRSRSVVGL